jgi:rhodanese-related sulfurtransferase
MSDLEIDVHSVHKWLSTQSDDAGQPIVLIDCRERNEYDVGNIAGAVLYPMSSWPPPAEAIESFAGKRVIVHCHHGGRSLRVAHWFRQNGHPEATSMAGGIDLWSEEIDPTVPRY